MDKGMQMMWDELNKAMGVAPAPRQVPLRIAEDMYDLLAEVAERTPDQAMLLIWKHRANQLCNAYAGTSHPCPNGYCESCLQDARDARTEEQ